MWTCPHCGGNVGQPFQDDQLHGMLCLHPDCGRFVQSSADTIDPGDWDLSDM